MRLDRVVCEKLACSRVRAQEVIKSGAVFVDGKIQTKPAFEVEGQKVEIKEGKMYVSRGAYKLLGAIEKFGIDLNEKVVLDIGASTGGFSEVCLENGAKKVYALDVGKSQLDKKLKFDKRVIDIENTDFRKVSKEAFQDVDFITGDLSFISLRHIFPKLVEIFGASKEVCMLFKPQFECGKELAKKFKGVVLDKKLHKNLLEKFCLYLKGLGFKISGLCYSSIQGKEGNLEYLFYLNGEANFEDNISKVVDEAFEKLKKIKENRHFF